MTLPFIVEWMSVSAYVCVGKVLRKHCIVHGYTDCCHFLCYLHWSKLLWFMDINAAITKTKQHELISFLCVFSFFSTEKRKQSWSSSHSRSVELLYCLIKWEWEDEKYRPQFIFWNKSINCVLELKRKKIAIQRTKSHRSLSL